VERTEHESPWGAPVEVARRLRANVNHPGTGDRPFGIMEGCKTWKQKSQPTSEVWIIGEVAKWIRYEAYEAASRRKDHDHGQWVVRGERKEGEVRMHEGYDIRKK
jgi:hypothetical protein